MRTALLLASLLLAPVALEAQGIIIPRPCRMDRCGGDAEVSRLSSAVEASLDGRVLTYEVTETFINRGSRIGEADYLFPLPRGAAFKDLKLEIDGELVSGETLGAEEARRIYEEIVRRERDPALVEWMGHGLLRTRIFPIAPGEEKKVVVTFQMVAEREGDAVRVDYFRGSRFDRRDVPRPLPTPRRAPDRRRPVEEDDDVRPDGRASFVLTYPTTADWGTPYSPTHELRTAESRGRTRVTVRGDASDVTILLPLRESDRAAITVLTHDPSRDDGFALITLSAPANRGRVTPRDITLVLDVSGSMSGQKMTQARAAGRQLLATLTPRDRFRIVDFSSDVRTFRDGFVSATPENIEAAERYLRSLKAQGSTNISGALAEALSVPATEGRMPLVLFITDGEPTVGLRDPVAIADEAAKLRGRRRIFSFGVGSDVNTPLVERLALEGRGTAHFVRPEESVERAVALVASRLTSPVATDLRIRAEGVRLSRMHPSGPVDLFAGQDLVVLARYDGTGRARIRFDGQTADGPVSWTETVTIGERERDNEFIPRLWATQRVGWLSAERRRNGPSPELDEEMRELGERYGIPTELTSYFVKEPGMVIADGALSGVLRGTVAPQVGRATAVAPTAAAPAAPEARRERDFANARLAQEQMQAKSLGMVGDVSGELDAQAAAAGIRIRRAEGRAFTLQDSVWVDATVRPDAKVIRIKAYSGAYFKLLELAPALREALAIGDRVRIGGRTVTIEVGPDGVDALTAAHISAIEAEW